MAHTGCDITTATEADLDVLYTLASASLTLDTFSPLLLREKLFLVPRPDIDENQTLLATVDGRLAGMMQYVVRSSQNVAWLGIFAVEASYRSRGITTALLDRIRSDCRARGIQAIEAKGIPTNYLVPGIDPRYTAAICLLEKLGFTFLGEKQNLRAELDSAFDTADDEKRMATQEVSLRRAEASDRPALATFFQKVFGEDWHTETSLAMAQTPPAVHLAFKHDEIVGFAAHSGMNREWGNFGPMGVLDEYRKLGLGRVLLYRCMKDLKDAGHASAVIPWVGPYRFYCRYLTCAIDRVFWQYRLEL